MEKDHHISVLIGNNKKKHYKNYNAVLINIENTGWAFRQEGEMGESVSVWLLRSISVLPAILY